MARDSSGNYTLPLAPVVAGTPVLASWANTTMNDLAVAMTDSLSRSGSGGMSAALKVIDGVVGNPAITFINEPSSGIYREAQFDIRYSLVGVDLVRMYQDGGGERFLQFWDGTDWKDIAYVGGPGLLDADGVIPVNPGTTFDGYGVVSLTRPATGVIEIIFENAATDTFKQNVTSQDTTPNGTDIYQVLPEYIDASTVRVHNWFVNSATGLWTKQDNLARITIQRTLIE